VLIGHEFAFLVIHEVVKNVRCKYVTAVENLSTVVLIDYDII